MIETNPADLFSFDHNETIQPFNRLKGSNHLRNGLQWETSPRSRGFSHHQQIHIFCFSNKVYVVLRKLYMCILKSLRVRTANQPFHSHWHIKLSFSVKAVLATVRTSEKWRGIRAKDVFSGTQKVTIKNGNLIDSGSLMERNFSSFSANWFADLTTAVYHGRKAKKATSQQLKKMESKKAATL